MRKTQILTNLKETNCCEVTPIEKLIYFPTDQIGKNSDQFEISVLVIVGN